METLLQTLENLTSDSIVYFTVFFKDKSGQFFEYDESIKRIADKCPVPIYGTWDFCLGFGIVGGMLTIGFFQGERAAQMAQQILNGTSVYDIPVLKESPNRYMFDYHQIEKLGIKKSQLPAGSIVTRRLQRVLENLLDNAIKFSEKKLGITIGISLEKSSDIDVTLIFYIKDCGVGLGPDHLETLFFEPFTQKDSSSTRKYGGLGLGLCVCKSLVEMMNGSIWVQSEVGKGEHIFLYGEIQTAGRRKSI